MRNPLRRREEDHHGFEAVPAYIVADRTDKISKRIGYFGMGLLLLLFSIGGYIQSA
jgi:hypothetical protein